MASLWQANLNFRLNEYLDSSQKKSYFITAMTVLFVVVVAFFGIRPAVTAALRQNEDNKRRDEAIESLEAELSTLKGLTEQSDQKQELLDYFDYVFPEENSQENVLSELFSLAEDSNISLFQAEFRKEVDMAPILQKYRIDPTVGAQSVYITFEGDLYDIINYVKSLEENRRIYNIASVGIVRTDENVLQRFEDALPFRGNMELQYFYWNVESL